MFLAYLAVLAIPVAVGAYALTRAPSETEAVAQKVTPVVRDTVTRDVDERVNQRVNERVTAEVKTQAEPVIKSEVSRQVSESVKPEIESVRSELQQRIATIAVPGPDPRLDEIPALKEMVQSARSQAERAEVSVRQSEQAVAEISQQNRMQADAFDKWQRVLNELERNSRENSAQLSKLDSRLDRIEKIIETWQKERNTVQPIR